MSKKPFKEMRELCLGSCSHASTLQPWYAVAKSAGFYMGCLQP